MSGSNGSAIGIAFVVYVSTNIDDLLILAVFFADLRMRAGAVIVGRFIGLAVLVLASAAAALLALAVPEGWIALLGCVPLFLGLRLLPALLDRRGDGDNGGEEPGTAAAQGTLQRGFIAQALAVAGVTLANGGDNLGVYIPLFATAPQAIAIYVAVFAVMTAAWCALGYAIVNNPLIGSRIRRHGHVLLPVVLISLGLYILSGAAVLIR
ncbi:MAG: cadmium resistance transporter [Betaproteobacteria bacterium]|nr:MAG: cadmium resistance transporter [Betaproteobacteria bacterium]